MKKCLCAVLALFMVLSLAGCGGDKNSTVKLTDEERAEYVRADYLDLDSQAIGKTSCNLFTSQVFVEGKVTYRLNGQNAYPSEIRVEQLDNAYRTTEYKVVAEVGTLKIKLDHDCYVRVYGTPKRDENGNIIIVATGGVEIVSEENISQNSND